MVGIAFQLFLVQNEVQKELYLFMIYYHKPEKLW